LPLFLFGQSYVFRFANFLRLGSCCISCNCALYVWQSSIAFSSGCEQHHKCSRRRVSGLKPTETYGFSLVNCPLPAYRSCPRLGTGKTLLAKAIAAESGVKMFTCSGTDFYDVYTGVGARRIRETFDKLRNEVSMPAACSCAGFA
jgi:hypothetical protein